MGFDENGRKVQGGILMLPSTQLQQRSWQPEQWQHQAKAVCRSRCGWAGLGCCMNEDRKQLGASSRAWGFHRVWFAKGRRVQWRGLWKLPLRSRSSSGVAASGGLHNGNIKQKLLVAAAAAGAIRLGDA